MPTDVLDLIFSERISQGATGGPTFSTTLIAALGGWEKRQANWDAGRLVWDIGKLLENRAVLDYVVGFFRTTRGRAYGFLFKDWSDYMVGLTWVLDVLTYTGYQRFGTGNASTTAFQLYKTYVPDAQVYVSDVFQATTAYTIEVWDGTATAVFGVAPANAAVVRYSGILANEAADGARTTFTFSNVPSEKRKITRPRRETIKIYLDGVLKTLGTHYSIDYTTGVVTFVSAPGSNVKVQWAGQFYVPMRFDSDLQKVMIEGYGRGEWNSFKLVEVRE